VSVIVHTAAVVNGDHGGELGIIAAHRSKHAGQLWTSWQWECAGCGDHADRFWHQNQGASIADAEDALRRHCTDACPERAVA
jgi:hypothetical protein